VVPYKKATDISDYFSLSAAIISLSSCINRSSQISSFISPEIDVFPSEAVMFFGEQSFK